MHLSHDKTMKAHLKRSRFGQTCKPLTDTHGEALLTWYRAVSLARILVQPAKAQASTAHAAACGPTLRASLAKYDPDTHSLKTAQCSLLEDSTESLQTLPRWGSMLNGVVYPRPKSAQIMAVTEFGLLPDGVNYHHTPNTNGLDGGSNSRKALKARQLPWATPTTMDKLPPKSEQALFREMTIARPGRSQPANLRDQVSNSHNWTTPSASDSQRGGCITENMTGTSLAQQVNTPSKYPTPTACAAKGSSDASLTRADGRDRTNNRLDHNVFAQSGGGQLNPDWVEWLMGWPIGWTDLAPRALTLPDWRNDPANLPPDHPNYVPRVATGIKHRAARIKCIGNGQVPYCAATGFVILADRLNERTPA